MRKVDIILIAIIATISHTAYAHQPVMDMAPRWEEGYGFQVRQEAYGSHILRDGTSKVANPLNLKRHVQKTWLEGVYTFDRSKRVTFKLPYINQSRTKNINGAGVKQSNNGVGDLILAMPLKHYRNKKSHTDNFGFTPSIRIPTGSSSGEFALSDGSWDVGLSISHSFETPKYYTMVDVFYWLNNEGKNNMQEGDELGLDINLGYHPYHNNSTNSGIYIMWDISARHNKSANIHVKTTASGGKRIQTGPVLVLYQDNIMLRSEYKYPLYEKTNSISNSRGHELNIGIGMTF